MFQSPNLNRREASDRMYITANPGTFQNTYSDDLRESMHGTTTAFHIVLQDVSPRANAAFSSEPAEATMTAHIIGTQSPQRPAGTSGSIRSGNTP
jgi:hypothetical protein